MRGAGPPLAQAHRRQPFRPYLGFPLASATTPAPAPTPALGLSARAGFHSRGGPPAYIPIPVSTMPHKTPTTYSATRMTTFSRRL